MQLAKSTSKKIPDLALLVGVMLLFCALFLSGTSDLISAFVICYTVFTFIRYINNLGYTINVFDFLAFYSALCTLVSPLIAYRFFPRSDPMVKMWGAYMRVPEEDYFGYLIPANLALFVGLHLVFPKRVKYAKEYMERAKAYVSDKSKVGYTFIGIGIFSSQFASENFGGLAFVFYVLSMLSYVGGFYLYFSLKKRRNLVIGVLFAVFFLQSVSKGLFGEFATFLAMAGSLIATQVRFSFISKLTFFLIAFVSVLIIQSVKMEYRTVTWRGVNTQAYAGQGNVEIFYDLVADKISNPDKIMNRESVFMINRRFNQGWLVSMAMNYVPRVAPFADGETIWLSIAAILVPRVLWPDKPEAGGHANLARFVGFKRKVSYSMNIGPFGEGYGNFGVAGGIIFIFIYAALLGFFLDKTLQKANKYPSLIIWLPLLFFYVLTVETDILTTINTFVKALIVIYFIYWVAKKFFATDV